MQTGECLFTGEHYLQHFCDWGDKRWLSKGQQSSSMINECTFSHRWSFFSIKADNLSVPSPCYAPILWSGPPHCTTSLQKRYNPQIGLDSLTSAGMAFGAFECHLCNFFYCRTINFFYVCRQCASSSMSFENVNASNFQSAGKTPGVNRIVGAWKVDVELL